MKLVNLSVVFCALASSAHGQDLRHPNIILMMADDMGMGDTSAYQDFTGNGDSDQVHTPNMQRLARMGVRFTDAHTAASRCSPSRYGLLTGRYPWRNRLKHWVLFGAQGDPMIEADRPTIATLLQSRGYHTGVVGKWHVGLRYRQTNGSRAAEFKDADLRMPLADTPLDHGFDFSRITSRSHGTSGPEPGRKNKPDQTIGPGHIHGRTAIGATDNGRQIASDGNTAYILKQLGGRHSDSAIEFLTEHVTNSETKKDPVFLYYPSNSNHGPHTPDDHIGNQPVAGAARNVAGELMNTRSDYIYENDVALGRLMDWLKATDDPRNPGQRMIENTIVIFTSDNGAEKNDDVATGPFRSHKGSCYEGGHRVPFIAAWPAGTVGDGDDKTPGRTSRQLLGLTDLFATFSEVLGVDLPDNANGEKGGEDSLSILSALNARSEQPRPLFFNDHKEAKADHAVIVLRLDDPVIEANPFPGQWKLFFDASLLRAGKLNPVELYDLATDSREANNRISETELQPLVTHLSEVALLHRTAGGHRLAGSASTNRVTFRWQPESARAAGHAAKGHAQFNLAERFRGTSAKAATVDAGNVRMTIAGVAGNGTTDDVKFDTNPRGLGISSGQVRQVDDGETLLIHFDCDVIVESAAVVAGNGECGGYYQVGEHSPLAIYCVDGDIDANDQSGILSDIGVVKAGQTLRLDSSAHYGVETPGQWRLASLTVRLLK